MQETFIDLDELILRCRDKVSKKLIQEAVSCYRAGAYRSCIISTWNAIVFDFLHKLRELELFGDKEAKKQLEEFEKLRSSKQFKELWQFESKIPERAQEHFKLISIVEQSDIQRLLDDRSRCAHPSMTDEEPFEATAELARYHLRSAVTHLLSRPPVQGRAARDRIFQDIQSDYFPKDPEKAIEYFKHSPLASARFTLIKDVVIGLTKDLLIQDRSENERERQFSALIAISRMYHQETREILNEKLSNIILSQVKDENWNKVIIYLGRITTWDSLSEPCRLKAEAYINQLEIFETDKRFSKYPFQEPIFILVEASHVEFLRNTLINKLKNISLDKILLLVENYKDETFQEKVLNPVLLELSPQATLDQLLSIRSNTSLASDDTIRTLTKNKIEDLPLNNLTLKAAKYSQDKWLLDLIESNLEVTIPNSSLLGLLKAKSQYKSINEAKTDIINLFDIYLPQKIEEDIAKIELGSIVCIIGYYKDEIFTNAIDDDLKRKIAKANLEDLLHAKRLYKDIDKQDTKIIEVFNHFINERIRDIPVKDLLNNVTSDWVTKLSHELLHESNDEIIKPILRGNTPFIIDKFAQYCSINSAEFNVNILVKITQYLKLKQWRDIFDSFCKNNKVYDSWYDKNLFKNLFKESLKINNDILPDYWLDFRDRLDELNIASELKELIDSYEETYGSSEDDKKSQ